MEELWVTMLGEVPYGDAVALQRRLRAARQADAIPDSLLLLEHPPVYTRGRRTADGDLPMDDDWYRARGIELHDTDRGGQVTYHGPGQLVGYPIVRVESVRGYVRALEDAIVAALADEGIEATVPDGLTGVWAGDAKIASIGVHVSRHVATHGFAVNVDTDLEPFSWIRPCGADARMTSIAAQQGGSASMSCFRKRIAYRLAEALDRRQCVISSQRLHAAAIEATTPGDAGRDVRERSVAPSAPFADISPRSTSAA